MNMLFSSRPVAVNASQKHSFSGEKRNQWEKTGGKSRITAVNPSRSWGAPRFQHQSFPERSWTFPMETQPAVVPAYHRCIHHASDLCSINLFLDIETFDSTPAGAG
jgi:hypothetical protein